MMYRMTIALVISITLATVNNALLYSGSVEIIEVGDDRISIPIPDIFSVPSNNHVSIREYIRTMDNASENDVLLFIMSNKDIDLWDRGYCMSLSRYMSIQCLPSLRNITMEDAEYQSTKAYIRNNTSGSISSDELADFVAELNEKTRDDISELVQGRFNMKLGDTELIEFFDETARSISFSLVSRYIFEFGDVSQEEVIVTSCTIARVKNKVIYLYVSSVFNSGDDYNWLMDTTKKWVYDTLEANDGLMEEALSNATNEGDANKIAATLADDQTSNNRDYSLNYIAGIFGAFMASLLICFLLSRLFLLATRKLNEPFMRYALAHGMTLFVLTLLGGFGSSYGGPPRFGPAIKSNILPVIVLFTIDLFRKCRTTNSSDNLDVNKHEESI